MNYFRLTDRQLELQNLARSIAKEEIGPYAAQHDREGSFPASSIESLRDAGLLGLRVSTDFGGLGADLVGTCVVVEEISKQCSSTAMCYKMHLESMEAITLIPSPYQLEKFVKPLGMGKIFAAAAGGESRGKNGLDWRPSGQILSPITKKDGIFQLNEVRKSYVTSAGHATHYLMFVQYEGGRTEGPPDLLMIEADEINWQTSGEWDGLGMRGNSSAPMVFNGTVPEANLLGYGQKEETPPIMTKYMMPILILTYGAAYLGIAAGAFELACIEGTKKYSSGASRLDNPINQRRMAEMSARIEGARAFLHTAASMADEKRSSSLLPYLQAKVICSETAVKVTEEIMTMFGGTAFARQLPFERYFRDARAGLVMGVANDQAYESIGGLLFPE